MGPSLENYHFPSCTIPEPTAAETVSVVTASGLLPSASVHVGAPTEATVFATVRIEPSEMKHYLVLASYRQIIWNIEGDTDSVSRVIVLGATGLGPWAAGVIGVPKEKIIFTDPDLAALERFKGTMQFTSCSRESYACSPAQWFGDAPSDRVTFHPPPTQGRMEADAFVEPMQYFVRPLPWDEEAAVWPVAFEPVKNLDRPETVDPSQIVSLRPAQTYEQPAGQAGLDALVASGALLTPGDPGFDAAVRAYAEAFSARYRTRFDPDFLFVPQVDYVVTKPLTLPAASPSNMYLLGAGVPLPEMNGNDDYRTCFLELDRAGEPAGPNRFDGPYCRDNTLGMPEPDREMFYSAQQADNLEHGEDCRQTDLPEDAEIVVVNVLETVRRSHQGDPRREIAVEKTGDRPAVLYLHNSGRPAQWSLSGTGIGQVFMLWSAKFPNVTLNGEPFAQSRLGVDRKGCPWFPPYHLNAPGYLHLDKMMKTLLGRPIDRVVEVTLEGKDAARIVTD
jgi:hypothetical protein